jgi:hypothetical protein
LNLYSGYEECLILTTRIVRINESSLEYGDAGHAKSNDSRALSHGWGTNIGAVRIGIVAEGLYSLTSV